MREWLRLPWIHTPRGSAHLPCGPASRTEHVQIRPTDKKDTILDIHIDIVLNMPCTEVPLERYMNEEMSRSNPPC